jgi:hypothetical protein
MTAEVKIYLHHSWPQNYMEVSRQLHVPGALSPGKIPQIWQEARWVPESVWKLWSTEKSHALAGNRTPAFHPVARRYTDWPISAHCHFDVSYFGDWIIITFVISRVAKNRKENRMVKLVFNNSKACVCNNCRLTYLLTYGAEFFLRSCQLCSHSGNSQQF